MKRIYLMKNVNEKIFKQVLVLWQGIHTRKLFPDKYDTLKAYIMNENSSKMTQMERIKIIYNVIISAKKKSEQAPDAKGKFEDVTVESGDEFGVVGMYIHMDLEQKQVGIVQPKTVEWIIKAFQGVPRRALIKLMWDDVNSPFLKDQSDHMSKCVMLMFFITVNLS